MNPVRQAVGDRNRKGGVHPAGFLVFALLLVGFSVLFSASVLAQDQAEPEDSDPSDQPVSLLQQAAQAPRDPEGEEDEEMAQQATDYVAWLMRRKSNFRQIYDWMKSCLIYKNSVLKVWWAEDEEEITEEYKDLTEAEMTEIILCNRMFG